MKQSVTEALEIFFNAPSQTQQAAASCLSFLEKSLKPIIFGTGQQGEQLLEEAQDIHSRTSGVCGKEFTRGTIIFRCKDCQLDDTCVICEQCFYESDHKGHDYSMMRSGMGCCDCGDPEAWKKEGSCRNHQGPQPDLAIFSQFPKQLQENGVKVLSEVLKTLARLLTTQPFPQTPKAKLLLTFLNDKVISDWGLRSIVSPVICAPFENNEISLTDLFVPNQGNSILSCLLEAEDNIAQKEIFKSFFYKLMVSLDFKLHFLIHVSKQIPQLANEAG
eukprot:c10136_g1_i3.p1 GENE.c10136_g1_i3~~c10136_g1_i3.p1  ORF type:complete len:288 (+),score=101.35 c10136_g1_i3:41-865(+)